MYILVLIDKDTKNTKFDNLAVNKPQHMLRQLNRWVWC